MINMMFMLSYMLFSFALILILGFSIFVGVKKSNYDNSDYKKESGNNFFGVVRDKGKYGEYLSFNKLEKIKGEHRILTNVYLPKENGETTEVDLIYIHETGIYVLESKNYSGWIFGDEKSKYWMQTLENRRKEKFYNPIFQNNTHIKYLIKLLNFDEKIVQSIIVFSERCTLKKIEVYSENVKVIKRGDLKSTIEKLISNSPKVFEAEKIIELYSELKPYTCVKEELKEKHIEQVKQKQVLKITPKEIITNEKEIIKKMESDLPKETKRLNNEKIEVVSVLSESDKILEEKLKLYRSEKSKEEKTKPFIVFKDKQIEELINVKPKTKEQLLAIKGFGEIKVEKYGEGIINIFK